MQETVLADGLEEEISDPSYFAIYPLKGTNSEIVTLPKYNIGGSCSPVIPNIRANALLAPCHKYQLERALTLIQSGNERQESIDDSSWRCAYADDIVNTLRESELGRKFVTFRSKQVICRSMLLKLVTETATDLRLQRTTLHLAVYILDRVMDDFTIRYDMINLVAITCLIIASKMEEVKSFQPGFEDFNGFVNNSYTLQCFKSVECAVLDAMRFDLMRPTAATFAEHFVTGFLTLQDYLVFLDCWNHQLVYSAQYRQHICQEHLERTFLHSLSDGPCPYTSYEDMLSKLSFNYFNLIDVSLNYLKFTNTHPSIIASACISAVRQLNGVYPLWTEELINLTAYTFDTISPISDAIISIYRIHINKQLLLQLDTTPYEIPVTNILLDAEVDAFGVLYTLNTDTDESDEEEMARRFMEYHSLPKRSRMQTDI